MELKIGQNEYGRFGFFSDNYSMAFSLCIVGDDGRMVTKLDGDKTIRAQLNYGRGDDMVEEFNELFNGGNIAEIFALCVDYMEHIWTTGGDYKKDMEFFMEVYEQNRQELEDNMKSGRIKELEEELSKAKNMSLPSLRGVWEGYVNERNELLKEKIKDKEQELVDLKEGSKTHEELSVEIAELKNQLTPH